ncbi:peptide ABC transporter substrate-binding protein [Microvirga aerilata]|uniref:Peptide ABC transporter substrate-binding protein n=1 Tax=Microvirga aerilata TaxID=670292 RepID=A0A936ZH60_9HYPH|nr:peptide ABC transporter substrate-binding protein [Microvirga aerilata]MBL0404619.1 peptide ABC transporter substrate-binding protein [Microvirga aerilata]
MSSWIKRTALAAVATAALMGAASAEVVYNRANSGEPETLDTHKTSTVQEFHILQDMLEGLVAYDMKAKATPGQAEKWEISDDGKTYRFTLRNGLKWSNGDPVTAEDFVYSYRRIMDPATGAKYANILYPIKNAEKINKGQAKLEELGVKAVDPKTVEITLEQPTPYFIELLTHQTSLPVHKGSVEKFGKDFVKPGNMVTNGAYKLAEFVPNSHIKLVKNENYRDAKNVQIETVNYFPTSDFAAMVRRYEAGELDTTDDVPADQMKSLKERFKDQVQVGPWSGTWYFIVNSSKAPFNDVRVRQALSMAMDREFVADQIWGQTMLPGYSFMPPGVGNYGEPAYMDYKDASPIDREEKAKKLLQEAGFGPGKPLKVEVRYNTTDNNRNTVIAIADQWKQIGIETSFINTDGKTHFAHLRDGGDFDVARYGWIADVNDPSNFLFLLKSDNKGFNSGKYNNPEFDKLLDQAASEMDLKKRADIMRKAEAILMRDMPWIPIMYYGKSHLISPKIKGFEHNTRGIYPTRLLSKVQ